MLDSGHNTTRAVRIHNWLAIVTSASVAQEHSLRNSTGFAGERMWIHAPLVVRGANYEFLPAKCYVIGDASRAIGQFCDADGFVEFGRAADAAGQGDVAFSDRDADPHGVGLGDAV